DQALALGTETTAVLVRAMLGLADRGRILDLFERILRGDAAGALAELAAQYSDGADPRAVLGDLAEVSRSARSPATELALVDGQRALLIAAQVEDDLQVDVWADALRAEIADFDATLPAGLSLNLVFDQSRYTADRLNEVMGNLALGVAIVFGVLVISMGWRAAVVVGAMLPLTGLLSLVVLERLGVTIHQMSVTGLIVALGLLVDAAIVTTDEIRRRLAQGTARLEAIAGAVRRLTIPLAASTLTTVLAFVPMAALPGPAGDFVGAIALSVIVMLFTSLLLALTVVPAIAGRLLPAYGPAEAGWLSAGISGGLIGRFFARSLTAALAWPRLAMACAAAPAIVGFLAFPTLTAQFFPEVDRDQFHVQLELPAGSAIAETERLARAADSYLQGVEGIEQVQWVIGRSAPAFYYNMLDNRDQDATFAEALVTTASEEATNAVIPALQDRLDTALPGARVLVRGLKQGPPVDAPLEMRLTGPNIDVLRALGEEARRRMAGVPAVTHARATLTGGAPKLVFDLDEDRVRLAGLTLGEVAGQLQGLTEGTLGGSLVEGPEELPVRLRLGDDARAAADALAQLTILPSGATGADRFPGVPLSALGTLRLEPSESAISRRDGVRVNTVQGFLVHGILPDEALVTLQANLAAAPLDLPPGYAIEWGGDTDARGETVNNLLSVVGLVVVATVATIVLTFNAWRLSIVTLVVAVLSMGLSLLALEIFRYPFGIQALIGVIGAIGVSINAAIIILTALQESPQAAAGDRGAMRDVVLGSSRHIVSTTITTFGGFLPLILAGGGFWPPFAMAIAGGVLLSAIVSFYFVPPAFRLLAPRPKRPEAERPAPPAAKDDDEEPPLLLVKLAAE
ncbi:MAG: efflux RND transporter permease subunit, partial [Pseudomonadota bacterium]